MPGSGWWKEDMELVDEGHQLSPVSLQQGTAREQGFLVSPWSPKEGELKVIARSMLCQRLEKMGGDGLQLRESLRRTEISGSGGSARGWR